MCCAFPHTVTCHVDSARFTFLLFELSLIFSGFPPGVTVPVVVTINGKVSNSFDFTFDDGCVDSYDNCRDCSAGNFD